MFAVASLLLASAGGATAQEVIVSRYYTPTVTYQPVVPAVSYYSSSVEYYPVRSVSYFAAPTVSYYTPAVSYYPAPVVSYSPSAAVSTTRYGVFGRPRRTATYIYP
jgi:hypothetical protein